MSTFSKKAETKTADRTADERIALYLRSPYFVQKNKDAKAFLERVGLPQRYAERGKNEG